jgi:hypothetical protein
MTRIRPSSNRAVVSDHAIQQRSGSAPKPVATSSSCRKKNQYCSPLLLSVEHELNSVSVQNIDLETVFPMTQENYDEFRSNVMLLGGIFLYVYTLAAMTDHGAVQGAMERYLPPYVFRCCSFIPQLFFLWIIFACTLAAAHFPAVCKLEDGPEELQILWVGFCAMLVSCLLSGVQLKGVDVVMFGTAFSKHRCQNAASIVSLCLYWQDRI